MQKPRANLYVHIESDSGDFVNRLIGEQAITWLNGNMDAKREAEPQRQSYGLIKGNFVVLTEIDWTNPPPLLLIGEGAETVLSAMQVTVLPGIATAGAGMMKDLNPPCCAEYVIIADNGDAGQEAARKLALKLQNEAPECVVRIATPAKPEGGKDGYDWNDLLMDGADPEQMKDAIVGASVFDADAAMTVDEKYEARIAALAALESRAYDAEREAIKKDFGVRLPTIDEDVKRYRAKTANAQQATASPPDIEMLAESAKDIIACEDILTMFAEECAEVIAGEENLIKLLYLSATSRLFDKAMHVAVKGTSSGGKSEVRRRVLDFFPPESVFAFTALSEKALLYVADDFCNKVLSMGEAFSQEEKKFQDYILRELLSEGTLRYPVVQKQADGTMETITIEKHGPVAFMVTTTRNRLHPENETRMLSVEVDDSAEQTRRVIQMVAEVEGRNMDIAPEGLASWHDYQRWLAAGECRVFVPWAPELADLITETKAPRLRRDFGQLLRGIKAHALLHQEHRRSTEKGQIVASIDKDYTPVRRLLAELLATASELKTRKAILETVAVVEELQFDAGDNGVAVRDVAAKLTLDMSSARRRLQAAEMVGFIVNLETGPYRPGRYKTTAYTAGSGKMLPTAKQLKAAYDATKNAKRSA